MYSNKRNNDILPLPVLKNNNKKTEEETGILHADNCSGKNRTVRYWYIVLACLLHVIYLHVDLLF